MASNQPLRIACSRRVGHGHPVVLLHGFAEDHRIWEQQAKDLSKHNTVFLPDLPGTRDGVSLADCTIDAMASALHSWLQEEQCGPVVLLGHSMGGYVGLAYAELFPADLAGLGLIHSTAAADSEEKKENRSKSIRLIERAGPEVFLRNMVPNLYAPSRRDELASVINRHLDMALSVPPSTLIAYYRAMIARPDRQDVLRMLQVPVLLVMGREDQAVPWQESMVQSVLPQQAMVELLGNTGHTGMHEYPGQLSEILNNFCQYVWQGKIP